MNLAEIVFIDNTRPDDKSFFRRDTRFIERDKRNVFYIEPCFNTGRYRHTFAGLQCDIVKIEIMVITKNM